MVGTMGSGKTTLGRHIARRLGIPHVELDQFYWQPGWTPCPTNRMRELVAQALSGDAWVVDGNHGDVRDLAWGRADTLVWLDFPVAVVLWRLARRTFRRLAERQALWNGNRERIGNVLNRDDLFLWVHKHHREKRDTYPTLLETPEFSHLRLARLRSTRRARQWIRSLPLSNHVDGVEPLSQYGLGKGLLDVPPKSLTPRSPVAHQTIVHLADYGGPYSGNFVASLRSLETALSREPSRQILIFPARALHREWLADLVHRGARVYVLPEDGDFIRTSLLIWRILVKERASIVHVHFARWDIQAWLAAAIQRLLGLRLTVIWQEHGGSLPQARTPARRLKDLVKLRIMGRWVGAIAVSTTLRDDLVQRGFPDNRAYFVPNRIDLERATAVATSRAHLRQRLDVPDDATLFLTFGWDPARKGVDLALKAMDRIASSFPSAMLLLVGGPPMNEFVQRMLGDRHPAWLRIAAPSEFVADFYGAADVFLAPSREEGMPYSVAEAMANRLPVIASDIGGHLGFEEAPAVVLFRNGTINGLAAAIRAVCAWSPDELARTAEGNRAFAFEHFSLDAWTADIIDVYGRILARSEQNHEGEPYGGLHHRPSPPA